MHGHISAPGQAAPQRPVQARPNGPLPRPARPLRQQRPALEAQDAPDVAPERPPQAAHAPRDGRGGPDKGHQQGPQDHQEKGAPAARAHSRLSASAPQHAGSLDSYLLKTDPRLLGWTGLLLRARANASYASTARADDKFRDEYEAGLRRQAELDALVADELARLDAEDEAGEPLEGVEAETEASEAPRV
jgi:hypothetical protein